MVEEKKGGIIFSLEAVCRSDSGADTRGSENTFPASLADESERGRGGKTYSDGKRQRQTERRKSEKKKLRK